MEFILIETFNATSEQIYNAWLESDGHTAMTGSTAEVSNQVGGKFSAWDGYITGENVELKPFSYIKQLWRTTDFASNQKDSVIEITLKEITPGTTELTLKHSELNDGDKQYIEGWLDFYFKPMKKYFKK